MELRLPPLLAFLIAALLIWGVDQYVPLWNAVIPGHELIAGLLAIAGVIVGVLGVVTFRRARTTVSPLHPEKASALVTHGIYRFSRNPMYLGMALMLVAWVVYLSAWPGLFVVGLFVALMNRLQIAPEERALEQRFGEAFGAYRRSVRRWL